MSACHNLVLFRTVWRFTLIYFLLATTACSSVVSAFVLCPPQRGPLPHSPLCQTTRFSQPNPSSPEPISDIQFLGKGPDALVKEGVVLVAPLHEFNHHLRQSVVFIYDIGYENDDDAEELEEDNPVLIRGVVVDSPTPFTIHEMTDGSVEVSPALRDNLVFRGGNVGDEGVVVLNGVGPATVNEEPIGSSGIYLGGGKSIHSKEEQDASLYKFFFQHVEFRQEELEDLLEDVEEGDGWISLQIPPAMVLNGDYDNGDCWKRLRNHAQQRVE